MRLGETVRFGNETRRESGLGMRRSLTRSGVEVSAVPHSLAPVC